MKYDKQFEFWVLYLDVFHGVKDQIGYVTYRWNSVDILKCFGKTQRRLLIYLGHMEMDFGYQFGLVWINMDFMLTGLQRADC